MGTLEYSPIFLAGFPHSWRVDDRKKLLDMVDQDFVEESLIPLLKSKNKMLLDQEHF